MKRNDRFKPFQLFLNYQKRTPYVRFEKKEVKLTKFTLKLRHICWIIKKQQQSKPKCQVHMHLISFRFVSLVAKAVFIQKSSYENHLLACEQKFSEELTKKTISP